MEGEGISELAAPSVLAVTFLISILSALFDTYREKKTISAEETQILEEIKRLRKEANSLSAPSTFAQSTKLKRVAAAKEKELSSIREKNAKGIHSSANFFLKILKVSKVCIYLGLTFYFWNAPIAVVPSHLLQPFGNALASKMAGYRNGFVKIGIIPWLVLTSRFSYFFSHKLCPKQKSAHAEKSVFWKIDGSSIFG